MEQDNASNDSIEMLRAEMAALREEFSALRNEHHRAVDELAALREQQSHNMAADEQLVPKHELQITSRRRLFALAGGVAAAAVGIATSSSPSPAAAANGDAILIGDTTVSSIGTISSTFLNHSPATSNVNNRNLFAVGDDALAFSPAKAAAISGYAGRLVDVGVSGISARSAGNGVFGWATHPSSTAAYGLYGVSNAGPAVVGDSATGVDLYARGSGRILLKSVGAGPPATGTFAVGEIVRDATPNVWICTVGGASAQWKRMATSDDLAAISIQVGAIAHPASLVLVTPTRVYDSRLDAQGPGNVNGRISGGANRTINIANGIDTNTGVVTTADLVPPAAEGIVCNLTIADADGGGFLSMTPGDAATLTASTINWAPGISNLANGATVKLDAQRSVKVFAGGPGSVHFIIDIAGYYL